MARFTVFEPGKGTESDKPRYRGQSDKPRCRGKEAGAKYRALVWVSSLGKAARLSQNRPSVSQNRPSLHRFWPYDERETRLSQPRGNRMRLGPFDGKQVSGFGSGTASQTVSWLVVHTQFGRSPCCNVKCVVRERLA